MPAQSSILRLAVLIDADNVSPSVVNSVFSQVGKLGDATVRRVYGNLISTGSKKWRELSSCFALESRMQFVHSTGKNATDFLIVIDAMELLADARVDGFCVVSSDGDFATLANHLRQRGRAVYGFGKANAPACFRRACDKFIEIKDVENASKKVKVNSKPIREFEEAVPVIRRAIEEGAANDGWIALSALATKLRQLDPDFSAKSYGSATLVKLVKKTDAFHIDNVKDEEARIRLRRQRNKV
jgi:hypothetical protein